MTDVSVEISEVGQREGAGAKAVESSVSDEGATSAEPVVPVSPAAAGMNASATTPVKGNLDLLSGVELPVTLCFGRRRLKLRDVLDLNAGSVVELDRQVEEPVELLLDGRVIARGEVVVVDGSYGLRVLEVVHGAME